MKRGVSRKEEETVRCGKSSEMWRERGGQGGQGADRVLCFVLRRARCLAARVPALQLSERGMLGADGWVPELETASRKIDSRGGGEQMPPVGRAGYEREEWKEEEEEEKKPVPFLPLVLFFFYFFCRLIELKLVSEGQQRWKTPRLAAIALGSLYQSILLQSRFIAPPKRLRVLISEIWFKLPITQNLEMASKPDILKR